MTVIGMKIYKSFIRVSNFGHLKISTEKCYNLKTYATKLVDKFYTLRKLYSGKLRSHKYRKTTTSNHARRIATEKGYGL